MTTNKQLNENLKKRNEASNKNQCSNHNREDYSEEECLVNGFVLSILKLTEPVVLLRR